MPDVLVLQTILTEWTKAARGGPLASKRNKVPKALELAPVPQVNHEGSYLLHQVRYGEKNDFQSPLFHQTEVKEDAETIDFGGVQIIAADSFKSVFYRYDRGAPRRLSMDATGTFQPLRKKAFEIREGQWGQVEYNGRFSDFDTGEWWYQKWTINVGIFHKPVSHVFLHTTPIDTYSEMALLR